MQLARFIRTMGLCLVVGLAGLVGGCGLGSPPPVDQEKEQQIRESKKSAHQEVKATVGKGQQDLKNQGATRKNAHRKGAGP